MWNRVRVAFGMHHNISLDMRFQQLRRNHPKPPLPSLMYLMCLCMQGPSEDHIYLVGTEEGTLHRCSKAYGSEFLSTYQGHSMPVYSVRWNPHHPRMFLSGSADWSVKLWDAKQESRPLMSFDLGDAVGDVAWAPYSATVFAAATDDGRVHVFDLKESRLLPLCSQKVSCSSSSDNGLCL